MKVSNYVNEAKRTCVTVISDCEFDVISKVRKEMKKRNINNEFIFRGDLSYLREPIRGKAKCSPEDTFDAELGLRISRARAFHNYNVRFNKELDHIFDVVNVLQGAIDDIYYDDSDDEIEAVLMETE